MQTLAMQVLVVAMMLAIGMDLPLRDLLDGPRRPWAFSLAIGSNLVAFPAAALAIASMLDLSPGITAGVVLVAAAPGGPTGPLFSQIAKAHLGFATSLMVALSLIGVVSAPITVQLILGEAGGAQGLMWPMLRTLLIFQITPLLLAMGVRRWAPTVAKRLTRPLSLTANVLLLVIIVGLLATKGALLLTLPWYVHVSLAGLLAATMLPALWRRTARVLHAAALVTTVRNLGVALMLASAFFPDPQTDVLILSWGLWMMLLPGAAGWWLGRRAD